MGLQAATHKQLLRESSPFFPSQFFSFFNFPHRLIPRVAATSSHNNTLYKKITDINVISNFNNIYSNLECIHKERICKLGEEDNEEANRGQSGTDSKRNPNTFLKTIKLKNTISYRIFNLQSHKPLSS